MKNYPYISPYIYGADNPIAFIEENGEGPIASLLKFIFGPVVLFTKTTQRTIMVSVDGNASAGLGVFLGAGGAVSAGMAIDPKGNFGLVLGTGYFGDLASALGGISCNGIEETGNIALGVALNGTAGFRISNVQNITDLGGEKEGRANSPKVDINAAYGLGGSMAIGSDNWGVSVGVGIGVAISKISTDNFVFATNPNDIDKFEDAYNDASSYAKNNDGEIRTNYEWSSNNTLSIRFDVYAQGANKPKQFDAMTITVDEEKSAVYTGTVK
jgi:hypothetical protein